MPVDDSDATASRLDLLQRIADALDLPPGALHEPEDGHADRGTATPRDEARAMLAAFVRIRDPERRRACLDYVLEIVDADRSRTEDVGPDPDAT